MKRLYNSWGTEAVYAKKARKVGLFLIVIVLPIVAISCRKGDTAPSPAAAGRPAGEAITQTDQLFQGREDLVKVRQGVVALRQAQAEDQGNYELAWWLAKFNYYLGDRTPDTSERDKAFHDGIEAGKLAVKLQDGKPEGHFWLGANYGGSAQTSMLA